MMTYFKILSVEITAALITAAGFIYLFYSSFRDDIGSLLIVTAFVSLFVFGIVFTIRMVFHISRSATEKILKELDD